MKISKAGLVQTIDDIEAQIKLDQEEYDEALVEFAKRELATWKDEELPKWRALRDLLTTRLKAGATISQEEVNKTVGHDGWGSTKLPFWRDRLSNPSRFTLNGKEYNGRPAMDKRLAQLRRALEIINDEEVATSALASLGFRNMDWFFNKVARKEKGLG